MTEIRKLSFISSELGLGIVLMSGIIISSKIQATVYKKTMHKNMVKWLSSSTILRTTTFHSMVNWDILVKARKDSTLAIFFYDKRDKQGHCYRHGYGQKKITCAFKQPHV